MGLGSRALDMNLQRDLLSERTYVWKLLHHPRLLYFMKARDLTHHFLVSSKQFVLANEALNLKQR